jgi:hypothetical protein
MESKIAGMIGAAALAAVGSTQVAAAPDPEEVLQAKSFAELLQPIPNAKAILAAVEAAGPSRSGPEKEAGGQQVAQYYYRHYHHHHHHHHHGWWRRRGYHHHHHHHHYYW